MLKANLHELIHGEDGMNMVEYALVGAFVSIAGIGALRTIGPRLVRVLNQVSNSLR